MLVYRAARHVQQLHGCAVRLRSEQKEGRDSLSPGALDLGRGKAGRGLRFRGRGLGQSRASLCGLSGLQLASSASGDKGPSFRASFPCAACVVEEGMALLAHSATGANVSTIRHFMSAPIHVGVLAIRGLSRSFGKGLAACLKL